MLYIFSTVEEDVNLKYLLYSFYSFFQCTEFVSWQDDDFFLFSHHVVLIRV